MNFAPALNVCSKCALRQTVVTSESIIEAQNTAFSYQIKATQSPVSFTATGMPSGLSLNTSTGVISGTITTIGTYSFTVTANNLRSTGSGTVTVTTQNHLIFHADAAFYSGGTAGPTSFLTIALDGATPIAVVPSTNYRFLRSIEIFGNIIYAAQVNKQVGQQYYIQQAYSGSPVGTWISDGTKSSSSFSVNFTGSGNLGNCFNVLDANGHSMSIYGMNASGIRTSIVYSPSNAISGKPDTDLYTYINDTGLGETTFELDQVGTVTLASRQSLFLK